MLKLLAIGGAGGLGALSRFGLTRALHRLTGLGAPWVYSSAR